MNRKPVALFLLVSVCPLAAQQSQHLFQRERTLTGESPVSKREIADGFLKQSAAANGLSPEDAAGAYLIKQYVTAHNGVTHVVYRQQFLGIDVYGAEWVVNIDRDGRVINAGGQFYPRPDSNVFPPPPGSADLALRSAVNAINPAVAERFYPFQKEAGNDRHAVAYSAGGFGADIKGRAVWYAVNGKLQPAWMFQILDEDGVSRYNTVVDGESGIVLKTDNLTAFQSAPRGLVYERESPQPNPKPGVFSTAIPPFVPRTLQSFAGDPVASPKGWVANNQTSGNNTVTGQNTRGLNFVPPPYITRASNGDFSFPLELGDGAPNPIRFADAANTNLFYWANRCHDLFYQLGFDEESGNFQVDNLGRGGVGGDPVFAYNHYGAAANTTARVNNAFFSWLSTDDGSPIEMSMFLSSWIIGGSWTDGAYDASTIVHEYGHGVSGRLARNAYNTFQGASMGEAWSDYFSMEFLTPEGSPVDGSYDGGGYLFQSYGVGIRTRPYSTNMEINPLTYAQLGRVIRFPEVHADGEIWMEALWDMRANLIAQFGEREGRRRANLLIIDGMKLSVPASSMVDMRDAILLADRTDFGSQSQNQIWAAFAKRGLGSLAYSANGNSTHIVASFETPSPAGSIRFHEEKFVQNEFVRILLQDSNLKEETARIQLTSSSGDLEDVILHRNGPLYIGSIPSSDSGFLFQGDKYLDLIPGDYISAYYVDQNTGSGPKLVEKTVETIEPYFPYLSPPGIHVGQETPLNLRATAFTRLRYDLPFEFPFFNKKYSSLWVFTNGLVAFELPVITGCSDANALGSYSGIATMFMNLTTAGIAQSGENVYVSRRTPDAVTFRWAAETMGMTPPQPVNFALTLWNDGRIEMQYGAGNRNLSGGSRYVGCNVSTPLVGISNGNGTFAATIGSPYSGRSTLENAASIIWEPPFGPSSKPHVIIDSPAPDQRFKGVMEISGISADKDTFVSRVDVLIDNKSALLLFPEVLRFDYCDDNDAFECPFVGFSTNLDLEAAGIKPGAHQFQIRATNAKGAITNYPDTPLTFHVDPGQSRLPVGGIDTPAEGAEISGALVPIRGYAYIPDMLVAAVDVVIDGVTYGQATYGQRRDDVCPAPGSTSPPNCPFAGFQFPLNTLSYIGPSGPVALPNGTHALQIRVRDESGRVTLIPETPRTILVNNPVEARPVGVLTSPVNGQRISGVVRIAGHVYSPTRRISSVVLRIDGENRRLATYGLPRPDACAALPDVAACPNIGFEVDFDTRTFPNGPHVLGIRAIDDRGIDTIFPRVNDQGINITINNP